MSKWPLAKKRSRRLHISVDCGCSSFVGNKVSKFDIFTCFPFIPCLFNLEPHGWWDYLAGVCWKFYLQVFLVYLSIISGADHVALLFCFSILVQKILRLDPDPKTGGIIHASVRWCYGPSRTCNQWKERNNMRQVYASQESRPLLPFMKFGSLHPRKASTS